MGKDEAFKLLSQHKKSLPTNPESHASVLAMSEKQVLKNYREVPADILEVNECLPYWAKKAARS